MASPPLTAPHCCQADITPARLAPNPYYPKRMKGARLLRLFRSRAVSANPPGLAGLRGVRSGHLPVWRALPDSGQDRIRHLSEMLRQGKLHLDGRV